MSICFLSASLAPSQAQQVAPPQIPTTFLGPLFAPAQRFGISTHLARTNNGWSPNMVPMIRSMGVASIRDEDNWSSVEREKGVYKAGPLVEEAINRAQKQGLDTLFLLGFGNPIYPNKVDTEAFTRYALWTIEHYKGRVQYFELWSEPDLHDFVEVYGGQWNGKESDGSDSPWIKKFAEFVATTSRAIKQKYPDIKLVGCSANAPSSMRQLKYPEMWRYMDALAIHPYPYHLPPEFVPWGGKEIDERDGVKTADADQSFSSHIRLFREGLARAGRPNLPIWITEVGYSTAQVKQVGLWQGYTEMAQAIFTVRLAIQSAGQGVERTYFYDLYNDGNDSHEIEHNFGLVRRDYSLKPGFTALQHLCSLMFGDTRPYALNPTIERISPWRPEDKPQTYTFRRPDGSLILFVWQAGRIYSDAQDELLNLSLTNPTLKVVEAGRVVSQTKFVPKSIREGDTLRLNELPLGADPVYIILK